jgi:hypothetical protein
VRRTDLRGVNMLAIDDLREALGIRNAPEGDYTRLKTER